MVKGTIEEVQARFETIKVPDYNITSKKGSELPSYYVMVRNTRTGYTKLMPRHKAHRYINGRPSTWSITNPMVELKDKYELVK